MIFSVFKHVLNIVSMSGKWLELIQKFANEFLWQGHNKLSPKKCWNVSAWGGLNHLHVKHFFISLHMKWMIRLWRDKGHTWSCFAWPAVLKVYPEVILPGLTKCKEDILKHLPTFYAEVLRS